MEEGRHASEDCFVAGYVNWRNRPVVKGKQGGMLAATFVLGVEVMENLAFLANASNLVLYLHMFMHMSLTKAATTVTNFMGTAFLFALVGGFFSDAFSTTFHVFLISAFTEFLGLVILTVQANTSALQPAEGKEPTGRNAAILFLGLYMVAFGVGGIKGSLPAHGAEQFDDNTLHARNLRSTFFNYFVFCLATGALIAVTFVVWIEDNKGWQWGFGISTATILLSIPVFLAGSVTYRIKIPTGSPFTTITKFAISAAFGRRITAETVTENKNFLHCTVSEAEEVKTVLKLVPIFISTIMLNCCLAQLSTFSVEQAAAMNTTIGSLTVPPASLPVFPVVFIMILAPIYDHLIIPFFRTLRKNETGITHLQRIGIGLIFSIVAMAAAALVEIKRKKTHQRISFLWISFQYLFLGSADLFTLAGLLELFFSEAATSMRSLATSFSFASLALGYYLSSVIVSVVNGITGWLAGGNLRTYRLDGFYWLMCGLSVLNFISYLFWAIRYKYKSPI